MNRELFAIGEFYHVYNRGVDKRAIFLDDNDRKRFLQSMVVFNTQEAVGSIYEHVNDVKLGRQKDVKPLVDLVCYCLNPNHYHFILRENIEFGISEFMRRIGGYTKYFNIKHHRSGTLFQGRYKSIHISSNEYLLHLSAYVNLNWRVHQLGSSTSKSSWSEYMGANGGEMCNKGIILKQFKNNAEYREFAESSLKDILERKERARELASFMLE